MPAAAQPLQQTFGVHPASYILAMSTPQILFAADDGNHTGSDPSRRIAKHRQISTCKSQSKSKAIVEFPGGFSKRSFQENEKLHIGTPYEDMISLKKKFT